MAVKTFFFFYLSNAGAHQTIVIIFFSGWREIRRTTKAVRGWRSGLRRCMVYACSAPYVRPYVLWTAAGAETVYAGKWMNGPDGRADHRRRLWRHVTAAAYGLPRTTYVNSSYTAGYRRLGTSSPAFFPLFWPPYIGGKTTVVVSWRRGLRRSPTFYTFFSGVSVAAVRYCIMTE